MSRILIKHGRVVDPASSLDEVCDVLVEDGLIAHVGRVESAEASRQIDAAGMIVVPGLIDTRAELREPGFEEDETIESGLRAALAGGFTTVACLPNTDPPLDTPAGVEFVLHQAARIRGANVAVIAAVSKGRQGAELAEIGSLVSAGAVAFSDAPAPIHNPDLMRRALEYCLMFDRPIFSHTEVRELSSEGIMHEGLLSTVLGLSGMPAEAEDVMTARDLRLAESTGGTVHLCNVSTSGSVELIRRAKQRGVAVTAGITLAHLTMDDGRLRTFDANYKVKPPLRSPDHVQACVNALTDGTLDVICTGHAPRATEKKMRELDLAPFGMTMLDCALSLAITDLIEPGVLDWTALVSKMSTRPAHLLGLRGKGTLSVGAAADIAIIDPLAERVWEEQHFRSKSRNSPLIGRRLRGRAETVIVGGKVLWQVADAAQPVEAHGGL